MEHALSDTVETITSGNDTVEIHPTRSSALSRVGRMHLSLAAALVGMPYMGVLGYGGGGRSKPVYPAKPCINCGEMKKHPNAFCSAKCCNEHKNKKNAITPTN
jgi:hypothetical protein